MKKILFMIPNLGGGGAERVLINLANSLPKDKYEVTILTLFNNGVNEYLLNNEVIRKNVFPIYFRGSAKIMKYFPSKLFCKLFIREKYDYVIPYLEQDPTCLLAEYDGKKIAWLHVEISDSNKFFNEYKGVENANNVYGKYDKIVCVSKDSRNSLLKYINVDKRKVEVMQNIYDEDSIISLSKLAIPEKFDENILNIVTVGRLHEQKSYDRLINVANKLKNQGYKFKIRIIGTGTLEAELKSLILNYSLNDYVELLGFKKNPYAYMKKSDLFICSSLREGFSSVVVESIILNKPVITTDCAGMKEIFGDYNCGKIVDNSEEGLYKGLKELLDDKTVLDYYRTETEYRCKAFKSSEKIKEFELLLESIDG